MNPPARTGGTRAAGRPQAAWFAQLDRDLRAFIARRVQDPAQAEDVLQDALLRIVRGLDRVRDDERLGAWAFTVARHALIDHYRRPGREVSVGDQGDVTTPDPGDSDEDPQAARLLAGWLRHAIADLPEPYRSTLQATELEGHSYAALAAREGVSVSAIKSRVVRGRSLLRQAAERCCEVQLDARNAVIGLRGRRCGCDV